MMKAAELLMQTNSPVSPKLPRNLPKCLMCGCWVVDGGIALSKVDRLKLSLWWLFQRGAPIFDPAIKESWCCQNCIRAAILGSAGDEEYFSWWPKKTDPCMKYYLCGWMEPCYVPLRKLSKQEVEQHLQSDKERKLQKKMATVMFKRRLKKSIMRPCKASVRAVIQEDNIRSGGPLIHCFGGCDFKFINKYDFDTHFCPKRKMLKCVHCGYFLYREYFPQHFVSYKCTDCSKVFLCESLARYHRDTYKYCFLCKAEFCNQRLLDEHLDVCEKFDDFDPDRLEEFIISKFKCHACPSYFDTEATLTTHIKLNHTSNYCSCNVCGKLFKYKTALKSHVYFTHFVVKCLNSEFVRCTLCNRVLRCDLLRGHFHEKHCGLEFKIHEGVQIEEISKLQYFSCQICSQDFDCLEHVNEHMFEVHYPRYKFLCLYCPMIFETEYRFLDHTLSTHKVSLLKLSCNSCTFRCADFPVLMNHWFQKHFCFTKVCSWDCDYCDFVYKDLNSLLNHSLRCHFNVIDRLEVLVDKTRYSCDNCAALFDEKNDIEDHLMHCLKDFSYEMIESPSETGETGKISYSEVNEMDVGNFLQVTVKEELEDLLD